MRILQTIASDPANLYGDKNVGDAPVNSCGDEEYQEAVTKAVLRKLFRNYLAFPHD